jgi:ABC-type transport system involved in multi-copper enzyme maturation permease subunit
VRGIWLIARSVLIEAVRRREVYVIVLASLGVIGAVMLVDFFSIEGLSKFYREISLKIMSVATALTTIVLAARQLPREFTARTIYTLLAKPVSRSRFLLGKLLGVMLAAAFCLGLFTAVFLAGTWYLGAALNWGLFAQYLLLQMFMMLILATLAFLLSLVMNLDAAITLGIVFFGLSSILMTAVSYIYDHVGEGGRLLLMAMTVLLPQLPLFDLSSKTVHAEKVTLNGEWTWTPVDAQTIGILCAYAMIFAAVYFVGALLLFRKRAL